jgi:hypothetical protein
VPDSGAGLGRQQNLAVNNLKNSLGRINIPENAEILRVEDRSPSNGAKEDSNSCHLHRPALCLLDKHTREGPRDMGFRC